MGFAKPRNFEGDFSLELNGCYENESDGVSISILRFKYFQKSLIEKIELDNHLILEELKNEDYDVARSMRSQPDVSFKLDFFIEQILKSNVVAIYSYFEFKLGEISLICEKNNANYRKIECFKKNEGKTVSIIQKYNSFLSEVIPDLIDHSPIFQEILTWKDIRNGIVHDNSTLKTENDDILDLLNKIEKYLDTIVRLINSKHGLIK